MPGVREKAATTAARVGAADGWGETKMEVPAGVDAPWTEEGE
jgi:hypothetical protein